MIFGHGDDAYRYGDKVKMDFSTNLPTFADLSALKAHLATKLDTITSYPEPEARELEGILAEELGIPTNSATEAIYLLAQLYRGWASIIPQPTFTEYADACKMHSHILSYYDNDDMELLPEPRLYWLCNPNNPTGNVMLKALMNHVIREHRNCTFIIDQSYEHYTNAPMLSAKKAISMGNVVQIHSFTKTYGIPGLRLGYITANPAIISRLRDIRHPYSVNSVAITAGLYLLKHGRSSIPTTISPSW